MRKKNLRKLDTETSARFIIPLNESPECPVWVTKARFVAWLDRMTKGSIFSRVFTNYQKNLVEKVLASFLRYEPIVTIY